MNKRILDIVDNPSDLKNLSNDELYVLANEIREEIVNVASKKGGHVASSLGAVEIILAVHSLIDSPRDKFIFDVGHQSYAHKLVTGRVSDFTTLRDMNGISGFTNPKESEHDVHFSGHASDSLSLAMGIAKANLINNKDSKVVVLIGDASIAGGMSFEALNNIGNEQLPIVIILNDNSMSISPSVGGFMNHLNSMRSASKYRNARNAVLYSLKRLGSVGDLAIKWGHASKESLKHFLLPNAIMFEELGIFSTPVVDGHDICMLKSTLKKALKHNGPVLVHATTKKGAGYFPAEKDPELFHGIGPFDVKTGESSYKKNESFSSVFGSHLVDLATHNKNIVALTAAMSSGTGLKDFQAKFPERFLDVGIAEEHLIGCAAGLAKGGCKPVVAVYSAFLQRALDQLITNISIEKLDVVICIDRAGIVGADGVSHHGLFDISYTRMIPNLTIITPSCATELKCALSFALSKSGPFIIRYPRGDAFDITNNGKLIRHNSDTLCASYNNFDARIVKKGHDVSIMAFGPCVKDALFARKKLKKIGISVQIVDMRFVKPLDINIILKSAENIGKIITVEDGIMCGGAGEGVISVLAKNNLLSKVKIKNLGIDDSFVQHGNIADLKSKFCYDANSIIDAVKSIIK